VIGIRGLHTYITLVQPSDVASGVGNGVRLDVVMPTIGSARTSARPTPIGSEEVVVVV